jgi:hypothetical protein
MKTEIAFILDRSGSMSSMTNAAISGFNEFLVAQQATVDDHGQPIPATFTLILFDHEYLPIHTITESGTNTNVWIVSCTCSESGVPE